MEVSTGRLSPEKNHKQHQPEFKPYSRGQTLLKWSNSTKPRPKPSSPAPRIRIQALQQGSSPTKAVKPYKRVEALQKLDRSCLPEPTEFKFSDGGFPRQRRAELRGNNPGHKNLGLLRPRQHIPLGRFRVRLPKGH